MLPSETAATKAAMVWQLAAICSVLYTRPSSLARQTPQDGLPEYTEQPASSDEDCCRSEDSRTAMTAVDLAAYQTAQPAADTGVDALQALHWVSKIASQAACLLVLS